MMSSVLLLLLVLLVAWILVVVFFDDVPKSPPRKSPMQIELEARQRHLDTMRKMSQVLRDLDR